MTATVLPLPTPGDDADAMISAAVRALAAGRNQSVPQIAAVTGIPYRTLHRKVIGQAPWTASEVKRMSLHFDIRIADLFSGLDGKACAWRDSNPQPSDP